MYHLKQVPLQTIKKSKLILNALQPLSILEDRDDIHFTPELVFSNTIRSLVHAQEMEGKRNESKSDDEGKSDKSLSFVIEKQEEFIYSVIRFTDLISNYFQSFREQIQSRRLEWLVGIVEVKDRRRRSETEVLLFLSEYLFGGKIKE